MTVPMPPPVTESDLLAYVDGRLAATRLAEIELHLRRCPQDAARVAADLALQEGLKVLFDRPAVAPARMGGRHRWAGRAAWAILLAAAGFMAGLGAAAAGLPLWLDGLR